MIYITVAIGILLIAGISLMLYSYSGENQRHVFAGSFGVCLTFIAGISALLVTNLSYRWIAAEHTANVINRQYGTTYSREEIFWARDVINTVQEQTREKTK